MTAASTTRAGRRAAERYVMRDTIRVERPKGTTTNPEPPFEQVTTWKVVYEGRARRKSESQHEQSPDVGDSIRTTQRYVVSFPVGPFVPLPGDRITWLDCPDDPARVGTRDRITGSHAQTLATARRVYVEQEV